MGHITLRTDEKEDAVIANLLELTEEKTATSAIRKAINSYCELIALRKRLIQEQNKYEELKRTIRTFNEAQKRFMEAQNQLNTVCKN